MANKIIIKNDDTAGNAPADNEIDTGELAVNTADGTLFYGDDSAASQQFPVQSVANLTAATIASGDFIAFSDEGSTGDPTRKDSIDDVASLFAGDGLAASSAVLSLDLVANGGLEISSNKLRVATGIAEHDIAQYASGVADNDFLRIDGIKVEGRSASQVLSDIGGVGLDALSVGSEGAASGNGALSYNNSTGVFTYTPPGDSSQSAKGLVELATTAETETGTDNTRAVTPDSLKDGFLGSTNITTLGTIGTGTWEGSTVAVGHGGTGATSLTSNAILTGNGSSAIQAESDLTFNAGTLYMNKSSGDPLMQFAIGGSIKWSIGIDDSDSDNFEINSTSTVGSSDFTLESNGDLTIGGHMDIAASHAYKVNGTSILSDSSGTMTLSNVDALDSTTAATIESSMESNLDTLNSVTSASSLATVGTITTGVWNGTAIAHDYIGADAIDGTNIADDAVDSEHLAADCINSASFIADNVINSEHYAADSIDAEHLNANSVNTDAIIDDAVRTAHIQDDNVTYAKIQNVSADERILGRVSGADGVIEELTKSQVLNMLNVEDGATAGGSVTVSDSTANTNFPIVFHNESSGALHDDTSAFLYNPSSGLLTAPGAITGGGLLTTGGNIVIPDNGYIGVATDTDMLQLDRTNQKFKVNAPNGMTLTDDLDMTGDIYLNATKKIIFDDDGSDHTYIAETAADVLSIFVGGTEMLTLDEGNDRIISNDDFAVDQANKLMLDDDFDSYLICNADDNMRFFTGGSQRLQLNSSGNVKFNDAYSFPAADGSANQVLKSDGSGTLSFAAVSSLQTTYNVSAPLTGSTTFTLDNPANLSQLDEDTINKANDKLLIYDSSASAWKYVTVDDLEDDIGGGGGGGSSSIAANAQASMADSKVFPLAYYDADNSIADAMPATHLNTSTDGGFFITNPENHEPELNLYRMDTNTQNTNGIAAIKFGNAAHDVDYDGDQPNVIIQAYGGRSSTNHDENTSPVVFRFRTTTYSTTSTSAETRWEMRSVLGDDHGANRGLHSGDFGSLATHVEGDRGTTVNTIPKCGSRYILAVAADGAGGPGGTIHNIAITSSGMTDLREGQVFEIFGEANGLGFGTTSVTVTADWVGAGTSTKTIATASGGSQKFGYMRCIYVNGSDYGGTSGWYGIFGAEDQSSGAINFTG